MASAMATIASTAVRIELPTMKTLLRDKISFGQLFIASLLSRSIELEADLVDHLFNSSERRLARVLLMLANMNTGNNSDAAISKINHESLAARVGTTRSRVTLFMNKFRKLGFIDYSNGAGGGLIVHPSLLNAVSTERQLRGTARFGARPPGPLAA